MKLFSTAAPVLVTIGASPSVTEVAKAAVEAGLVSSHESRPVHDLHGDLCFASCVFISGTEREIRAQLDSIEARTERGCLVVEFSTEKEALLEFVDETLTLKVDFLSAHLLRAPMGMDGQGSPLSRLKGAPVLLVPCMATRPESLERGRSLWRSLGCRVFQALPHEHDALSAATLDLPGVVSRVYLKTIKAFFPDMVELDRIGAPALQHATATADFVEEHGEVRERNHYLTSLMEGFQERFSKELADSAAPPAEEGVG